MCLLIREKDGFGDYVEFFLMLKELVLYFFVKLVEEIVIIVVDFFVVIENFVVCIMGVNLLI